MMQVVPEHLELICEGNDRENSTIYLCKTVHMQMKICPVLKWRKKKERYKPYLNTRPKSYGRTKRKSTKQKNDTRQIDIIFYLRHNCH